MMNKRLAKRPREQRRWRRFSVDPLDPPSGSRGAAETLMHAFARGRYYREIRRLVRSGGDIDVLDDAGETPLHGAASIGTATVVRTLLSLGARVDIAEPLGGYTPLHWAARNGRLGVVRALLRAGADLQARTLRGRTAAEVAEEFGEYSAARWLREAANRKWVRSPSNPESK